MGRQPVIQITCDRCSRVEHRSISEATAPLKKGEEPRYMFSGTYKGSLVQFEDLCSGCEVILDNHWEKMSKHLQKMSPIRQNKKKG